MDYIRIGELRNSSVLRIYSDRDSIQTDPDYQRMSEVWTLEKRQLLIDTIINDFDIPKMYFHEFPRLKQLDDARQIRYAVIDGRQRIESIWGFIEGSFPLADDFRCYADDSVKANGMTYSDLSKLYPQLRTQIDSYTLPIVTVETDDRDVIEEMFLRLNEAVPLNAAEKRNAMGGPMAKVIRDVSRHNFFEKNIPFSNKRYQHREVAAKFLLLSNSDSVGDTKKAYLDELVKGFKNKRKKTAEESGRAVSKVLDKMAAVFTQDDNLLRTQAMTVIYFLVFKSATEASRDERITRNRLVAFDNRRAKNRAMAEQDIAKAEYVLLEFDRMHLQGSNDRNSIQFRLETLLDFLT